MSKKSKVDKLLDVVVEWWKQRGLSESKIEVALQKGGLKRLLSKIDDETLSLFDRALAYIAAENGIILAAELFSKVDESWAQGVIAKWRKEEEDADAKTLEETAGS